MILSKKDAEATKKLLMTLISLKMIRGWWSPSGRNEDIEIFMDEADWEEHHGGLGWWI